MKNATPLIERLFRIALGDAESNIITTEHGCYFGAGKGFGDWIYTRDMSFAGVLGLNQFYPDIMLNGLRLNRMRRRKMGYKVSLGHSVEGIGMPWEIESCTELEFINKYRINNYVRGTDDVVWLWCAHDLLNKIEASVTDWRWLYETGMDFFENFYEPFYDPEDGLYRGQSSFVDIHFHEQKSTGYPKEWELEDCILGKALSTNCLYVLGMEAMSGAATRLGKAAESAQWYTRAESLRLAIRAALPKQDGTLTYYKDRHGHLLPQRHALGLALAVISGVLEGQAALNEMRSYPVSPAGVPLFDPWFPDEESYHNHSAWPFVDGFFMRALEIADGQDHTAWEMALLARTCVDNGTFHEVVDLHTGEPGGSASQLWSAAAFIGCCARAGLTPAQTASAL
ncbi:MGH1-like glycoside hydrolase domain-containing protein [Coraliomargarita parva]|uniref:MGH1-like glycoside hydrolase domain-containing protein n=1 Tax=Coraliomargarita parva TaxID=3014050 RepID=UPI0022B4AF68|nr:hypothetical protein [Coraliomargarita parva]